MKFNRPRAIECHILGTPTSIRYQLGIPSRGVVRGRFDEDGAGSILFSVRDPEDADLRDYDGFEVAVPVELLRRILAEHDDLMAQDEAEAQGPARIEDLMAALTASLAAAKTRKNED